MLFRKENTKMLGTVIYFCYCFQSKRFYVRASCKKKKKIKYINNFFYPNFCIVQSVPTVEYLQTRTNKFYKEMRMQKLKLVLKLK